MFYQMTPPFPFTNTKQAFHLPTETLHLVPMISQVIVVTNKYSFKTDKSSDWYEQTLKA